MCIEHDSFVPSEDLILPKPRRHFRATVHAIHWQLRSLIGVEGDNIVYYVTGDANQNIQRLDTNTTETETIKRLPFSPRCLVAENGWICCGGEQGEFAAIKLGPPPGELQPSLVDSPASLFNTSNLPIDLDSPRPEDAVFVTLARARSSKNLLVKSTYFGHDLVNCVTLWFPPTLAPAFEGAYHEPMAAISNNDCSVIVIKLEPQETDAVLEYPSPVNRAVISPDGRLLIAITDDPFLYIHERVRKTPPALGPSRFTVQWEWALANRIRLRDQHDSDPMHVRGSFAACFSSNGRYLAVGTQSASISVFAVAGLTAPGVDALITSLAASRPSKLGAVRDMAFAPGQSDLLAWTEDRGRVGVIDLRKGHVSRQILVLDRADDYEHIPTTDKGTIDPRLLEQRAIDAISSMDLSVDGQSDSRPVARESVPLSAIQVRSLRSNTLRSTARASSRYQTPLTPEETLVLEALQGHRRRQEERQERLGQRNGDRVQFRPARQIPPYPSARPSVSLHERAAAREEAATDLEVAEARNSESSPTVSRVINDVMTSIRDERERLRNQLLQTGSQEPEDWTRRTANGADTTDTTDWRRTPAPAAPAPGTETRATPVAAANIPVGERRALRLAIELGSGNVTSGGLTTSNMRTALDGAEERLNNIRNAMTQLSQAGRGPTTQNNAENNGNLSHPSAYFRHGNHEFELRRRERAASLVREWEANPNRRIDRFLARTTGVEQPMPDPYDTSGLAWSEDGRTLFVGADKGIYEFKVNPVGRMMFPSVTRR